MTIDRAEAADWMKRELARLRRTVRDPVAGYADYLAQNQAKIDAYGSGEEQIGCAAVGLLTVASHESVAGCMRVLDGDDGEWLQIDRGRLLISLLSPATILAHRNARFTSGSGAEADLANRLLRAGPTLGARRRTRNRTIESARTSLHWSTVKMTARPSAAALR